MSTLSARIGLDDSRRLWILVADLLAVTGIVAAGLIEHYGIAGLADPLTAAETILPFAAGWLLCAPLAGLYRSDVVADTAAAGRLAAVSALAAVNVGLVLRASPYFDGGAAWPFPLVMTATVLVVVVPWRLALARLLGDD